MREGDQSEDESSRLAEKKQQKRGEEKRKESLEREEKRKESFLCS